jgi:copper chaperone NosL
VTRAAWATVLALAGGACASGPPEPVPIDLANDVCAHCRMVISSRATAAELLAPGEEPRLFDDLGCLRSDLEHERPPAGSVIVVADHLTGEWLRLEEAVITNVPGLQTPMGSGLIAHRTSGDRDRDPSARGGSPYDLKSLVAGGGR